MENIKRLRKQHQLSQQSLAEALGLSRSTIAMWETGSSAPDAETILRLAEMFRVSTDYILDHDTASLPPSDTEVKFALFGGGDEITDEMYDEVKRFAEMVRIREEYRRRTD